MLPWQGQTSSGGHDIYCTAEMGADQAQGIDFTAIADNRDPRFLENQCTVKRQIRFCHGKQRLFPPDVGKEKFAEEKESRPQMPITEPMNFLRDRIKFAIFLYTLSCRQGFF